MLSVQIFFLLLNIVFSAKMSQFQPHDYWSDHRSHRDIVNLRTQKNVENAYHNFYLRYFSFIISYIFKIHMYKYTC